VAFAILPTLTPEVVERFKNKIVMSSDGCWRWTGSSTTDGYGQLSINHIPRLAHRISYAIHHKVDPGSMRVCHTCDHPWCVNPGHLELGTQGDNLRDMHNKGRAALGEKHGRAKLTGPQVVMIREALRDGASCVPLAKQFHVSSALILAIKKRLVWKADQYQPL